MRVQCPQCGAGGNIPDAKIPANGTNIVCPKCKNAFFVQNAARKSAQPQISEQAAPAKDAEEYYQAGIQNLKTKKVDAAIEQLRVAIEMNPEYAEAYRYLGLAYGQKNAWQEAGQVLQKAIALQPDDVLSLKNLGVAHLQQKRFAEAEQILQQALQYAPNDQKVQSYLEMAARGKEHTQQASSGGAASPSSKKKTSSKNTAATPAQEDHVPSAVQRDPVQDLLDKGVDFLENGQYNKAIETFQEVVRITPQSSEGYFGLGMVYENRKDWPKATEMYQRAAALNPDDSLAQENFKFAKKQQKKFKLPFLKK